MGGEPTPESYGTRQELEFLRHIGWHANNLGRTANEARKAALIGYLAAADKRMNCG